MHVMLRSGFEAGEPTRTRVLATLCLRVASAAAVPIRSFQFRTLSGTTNITGRRVACQHARDMFVPSLDIIKRTNCAKNKLMISVF